MGRDEKGSGHGVRLGRPVSIDPLIAERIRAERAEGLTLTALARKLTTKACRPRGVARGCIRRQCGRSSTADLRRRPPTFSPPKDIEKAL